uniref:Uncharacterized protein n=1 Tax=Rhizophora mucronata TaxID=61149 RepID=A0A2P2R0D6_RHIMU
MFWVTASWYHLTRRLLVGAWHSVGLAETFPSEPRRH